MALLPPAQRFPAGIHLEGVGGEKKSLHDLHWPTVYRLLFQLPNLVLKTLCMTFPVTP